MSATADLTALLSNAEMRREETHKDEWLDYYMAIKNRALEVIEDLGVDGEDSPAGCISGTHAHVWGFYSDNEFLQLYKKKVAYIKPCEEEEQ